MEAEECNIWAHPVCAIPGFDCYRRRSGPSGASSGVCICSTFYGFQNKGNTLECEPGTASKIAITIASFGLCYYLFCIALNLQTLLALFKVRKATNQTQRRSYMILASNLLGTVGGLSSQSILIIIASGGDPLFILHKRRSVALALNGAGVVASYALLLLGWKEAYLRSASMTRSKLEIRGLKYARFGAYILVVVLPIGYIVFEIFGLKVGSGSLACLVFLIIAGIVRSFGRSLAMLLLQSQSADLVDIGQRIAKYSRGFVISFTVFSFSYLLTLFAMRESSIGVLSLASSVITESFMALVRIQMANYLKPGPVSISSRQSIMIRPSMSTSPAPVSSTSSKK